jgi:hypothetical protein
MILYHVTTSDRARTILQHGFRDGTGPYGLEGIELRGVFLSDRPLDSNAGLPLDADTVIVVTIDCDEGAIADFELIEEGKEYREWCVPREVLRGRKIKLKTVPL